MAPNLLFALLPLELNWVVHFLLLGLKNSLHLHFTFKALIHFGLIFEASIRSNEGCMMPRFFFSCGYPYVPAPFIVKDIFSPVYIWLCQKSVECGSISGLYILFHWSFVHFFMNTTLSWLCTFVVSLEVPWCQLSDFILLFHNCVGYSGFFAFSYKL